MRSRTYGTAALACALACWMPAAATAQAVPPPPLGWVPPVQAAPPPAVFVGAPPGVPLAPPPPWPAPPRPAPFVWSPGAGFTPVSPRYVGELTVTLRRTDVPARRGARRPIGLLVAGAAALGASWLSNLLAGQFAGTCNGGATWSDFRLESFVPVLGPWLQLMSKPTAFDDDGWGRWLVADGIAQAAGLGLLIAALGSWAASGSEPAGVELDPMLGPGTAGAMLHGRF